MAVADPTPGLRLLPEVAREAIRAELERRPPRAVAAPLGLLARSAPVFVTLTTAGELRGCVGELRAQHDNLVDETSDRARAAAFQDPRFVPLTLAELSGCSIEVTILGPLVAVRSAAELDPARYGIEISDRAGRSAVLLPGIDEVKTPELQLAITRQKAGIPPGEPISIQRFPVVRIGADGRVDGSPATIWG